MSFISYIRNLFFGESNDNSANGAAAVREAMQEIKELEETEFTGYLGEPQLIEGKGNHFNRPVIEVPVRNLPFGGSQSIFFEVPGGGDTYRLFEDLLDTFDIVAEEMELLEGQEVPVSFPDGNLKVDWQEVAEDVTGEEQAWVGDD